MATIRAYTTIEQSRKLAEILPLESADMWWLYVYSQGKYIAMMYEEPDPHYLTRMKSYGINNASIKCWSLSALLNILPNYTLQTNVDGTVFIVCESSKKSIISDTYDNPVDACVEMIIHLNELNLL